MKKKFNVTNVFSKSLKSCYRARDVEKSI